MPQLGSSGQGLQALAQLTDPAALCRVQHGGQPAGSGPVAQAQTASEAQPRAQAAGATNSQTCACRLGVFAQPAGSRLSADAKMTGTAACQHRQQHERQQQTLSLSLCCERAQLTECAVLAECKVAGQAVGESSQAEAEAKPKYPAAAAAVLQKSWLIMI